MNPIIQKIKEEQKVLAEDIKQLRLRRKPKRREELGPYELKNKTTKQKWNLSYHYRHIHIAYCELRGRKRDQIEQPASDNPANESIIQDVKTKWIDEIEKYAQEMAQREDVCASA